VAEDRLLITAASAAYGRTLQAFLGSLSLNWPGSPRVIVYDLGLDQDTLDVLRVAAIEVRRVPPFVAHWRRHFTWKFWCWNDAPARDIFYLDAAVVVMRPLDDVYHAIADVGYFVVPTYMLLTRNASLAACRGCGVDASFREGRMTVAGGIFGFRREGAMRELLHEAQEVAMVEENMAATEQLHRHDQAVLSLLLHKRFGYPILSDGIVYGGWESPEQTQGQAIWAHRKRLPAGDEAHLAAHIGRSGPRYVPSPPERPPLVDRVGGRLHRLRRRVDHLGPEIYDGVRDQG
jgi:hypothetical protein